MVWVGYVEVLARRRRPEADVALGADVGVRAWGRAPEANIADTEGGDYRSG